MQAELDALVVKLEKLIAHNAQGQAERQSLQAALVNAQAERDALAVKLDAARSRLQALIDRLPEDAA